MKKLLIGLMALGSVSAFSATEDHCGLLKVDIKASSGYYAFGGGYYEHPAKTDYHYICGEILEEDQEKITLKIKRPGELPIRANNMILGTRNRLAEKVCQALNFPTNVFMGAKVEREYHTAEYLVGSMRGLIVGSSSKVATLDEVTCKKDEGSKFPSRNETDVPTVTELYARIFVFNKPYSKNGVTLKVWEVFGEHQIAEFSLNGEPISGYEYWYTDDDARKLELIKKFRELAIQNI